ncbi:MAG: hypothetical protein HZA36_00565 [Parcubacteria group bacterium]|nr:hypothetical protein [Parcubacteria group bacterium]
MRRKDGSAYYQQGDHVPLHVAIYQPFVTITAQQVQAIRTKYPDGKNITFPPKNSDGTYTIRNAMIHNQSGIVVVESISNYQQRKKIAADKNNVQNAGDFMGAKIY